MSASVRASDPSVREFPLTNLDPLPTMRLAAETETSRSAQELG